MAAATAARVNLNSGPADFPWPDAACFCNAPWNCSNPDYLENTFPRRRGFLLAIDRRTFLRTSLVTVATLGGAARAFAASAEPNKLTILSAARRAIAERAAKLRHTDRIGLVDFTAPSWKPRLHLVDLQSGMVSSFLTAHGRGSDPAHTGWLKTFSNAPGSYATSRGAYLTGAQYDGKYGRAMRLSGLDAENSNAEARAIVIHPAWYVSDDMIARYGKLGRSEGCFALRQADLAPVLETLGEGRLLIARKFTGFYS